MSKLKSIWKERAETRTTEPVEPTRFTLKTYDEIRQAMVVALKERLPQASHALDDPTSNMSNFVSAIAKVDADLFGQIEVLAKAFERSKR